MRELRSVRKTVLRTWLLRSSDLTRLALSPQTHSNTFRTITYYTSLSKQDLHLPNLVFGSICVVPRAFAEASQLLHISGSAIQGIVVTFDPNGTNLASLAHGLDEQILLSTCLLLACLAPRLSHADGLRPATNSSWSSHAKASSIVIEVVRFEADWVCPE
jgi:hypothetical protein